MPAMKSVLQCLLILIFFATDAIGQNTLTVGQVYDFDINDQFHYHRQDIPPNAKRITITGKQFSASNDTVFYFRYCDNYTTEVEWWPEPHLIYHFNSYIDTIFYTNLDTPICELYNNWPINDTLGSWFMDSTYISSQYCALLIYEYWACSNCIFEGHYYNSKFGQGTGLLEFIHQHSGWPQVNYVYSMRYYKKGTNTCGIPDMTTVGIDQPLKATSDFFIFPNPVVSSLTLHNTSHHDNIQCSLYNSWGQIIMALDLSGEMNTINLSHLKKGIYFLSIRADNKISTIKLIKK